MNSLMKTIFWLANVFLPFSLEDQFIIILLGRNVNPSTLYFEAIVIG